MTDSPDHKVTLLLKAASGGDSESAEELLPLVYEELRRLARARMGGMASGQTLQPTGLVHEAYLKLIGNADPGWDGRGHFFAAASSAMRQIIVDQARRRASLKRGGDKNRVDIEKVEPMIAAPVDEVLALDEAVTDLQRHSPRKAQLVLLRYFAGLTMAEAAAALGVSVGTAERDWRYVRAWLRDRLEGAGDERAT